VDTTICHVHNYLPRTARDRRFAQNGCQLVTFAPCTYHTNPMKARETSVAWTMISGTTRAHSTAKPTSETLHYTPSCTVHVHCGRTTPPGGPYVKPRILRRQVGWDRVLAGDLRSWSKIVVGLFLVIPSNWKLRRMRRV